MNDEECKEAPSLQEAAANGYNRYDPAEGIWNMVLSELLRKGDDVSYAIEAANKAVEAHRKLFKGN
jgi:hypothetical protein